MNSKKDWLKKSRLYLIADKQAVGKRPLFNIVKKAKGSGIDIVQLRDKKSQKKSILRNAYLLRKLLADREALFIVNDYIDIARLADSDGVHLGQADLPPEIARKLLGKDKIIGVSCHNLTQAIRAQNNGADYISIGPVFPTPTKPEYKSTGLGLIRMARKMIRIPFFAIGGIDESNIGRVLSSGAKRAAVCRAICQAKDISLASKKLSSILKKTKVQE